MASISLVACSNQPSGGGETSSASADDDDGTTVPADSSGNDPSATTGQPTTTAPSESSEDDDDGWQEGPKFDVHGVDVVEECELQDAGVYCKDGVAVECDGMGHVASTEQCTPDICLQGTGCVECLEGQYHCQGPRVMQCDTSGADPHWEEIEVCNPGSGQGCDQEIGACAQLAPVGTNVPTGEYYQFAEFTQGSGFMGGYDVDTFENKIYVSGFNFGQSVDVYEVELLDSDGDGDLEPNQHPDNPDEPGEIEERTITFIESIPSIAVSSSTTEIYALEDRIYVGGGGITEYVFGEGSSVVSSAPGWSGYFAQIGYDEINGVWYASNEGQRRVFQYDAESSTWGIAFLFPNLAGDHMDGLEVVTDPNTGTPYVYVSDMTSDFIGQYRLDPDLGWVQENLFSYAGTAGALVEGMGFGTLNHFWATGGNSVYELGGGDLVEYTEPEPEG